MKRSVIKELIKRSMREVAPKTNSGAMTPEEEKDAAAMAAINKFEKEEKERDLRNGPSVVPGAVPMKEGSNIPTDIEWEVADVLDYYDDYSADLIVHGHSPSTGKTYGGSVVGTEAGGGDWDFQESDIESIEEMPEDSSMNEASSKSAEILNRPAGHMTFEQMGMIIMLADAAGENRGADEFLSKVSSKKEADRYIESLISKVDGDEGVLAEAEKIVAAWAEKKTLKEADLSQANFSDLNQVVRNIAHVNEVGMEEAAMQAIEYIAEQFDVPVDFKDF
jgi:hypothetical protein